MFDKSIDTSAPIHTLLAKRWSGVAYDPDRLISDEDIRALAEAARWAPSCFGDQPWRYVICNKNTHPQAWQKAHDCLSEGNKLWTGFAPVLILACCDTEFSRNGKPNPWAEYDSGAASMSICLQAAALGLMTHQMAGFDKEMARRTFDIPERFKPLAMMAVGHQMEMERIPDQFREREMKARVRDPLREHFFLGEWDKGLE